MKNRKPLGRRLLLEELEGRVVPSGTATTSTNWAGYAISASKVTAVSGSWDVPTVTGSSKGTTYSAEWVGIDGYTSSTVEQIGTEADYSNGAPSYYAWYEMYPANYYTITQVPIKAGDAITASVTASGNSFALTITDTTTGKTDTVTKSAWRGGVLRGMDRGSAVLQFRAAFGELRHGHFLGRHGDRRRHLGGDRFIPVERDRLHQHGLQ